MSWFKVTYKSTGSYSEVREAYIQAYTPFDLGNKLAYLPDTPHSADSIYSIQLCAEPTNKEPNKIY